MNMSADCINTKSTNGRNATPLAIMRAAVFTLNGISLDLASDEDITTDVGALNYWSYEDDGYALLQQEFHARSAWGNFPGRTLTGGTYEERLWWEATAPGVKRERKRLQTLKRQGKDVKAALAALPKKPKGVKQVEASDWSAKTFEAYQKGWIEHVLVLCYRGGSLGSLGIEMLRYPLCITAKGAPSRAINSSGRLSYELIDEDGERRPQDNNTQSSAIVLLSDSHRVRQRFKESFQCFGVVVNT